MGDFDDDIKPVPRESNAPRDVHGALLPKGRAKGSLNRQTLEARSFAKKFTDSDKWEKMIWFWVENPEMMPAGVFSTIMFYRYGKPPQTVKVKGEIMARPYLGESREELALRARQLANRLEALNDNDAVSNAVLVNGQEEGEEE
jgi:hypothetical protein